MKVAEIMTECVVTIRRSATVAQAIALMQKTQLHGLLVEPESAAEAYGMVTEVDIVYKVLATDTDPSQVQVADIMTLPCLTLTAETDILEAARWFAATATQRAPVINGHLLGILSVSDLIMHIPVQAAPPPETEIQRYELWAGWS